MKTNKLYYSEKKKYLKNGETHEITVKIRLSDDCENGVCDFAITGDIYRKAKNGRWVFAAGGCCHDEILKRFPQFKIFVDLHLCNAYGQPNYPVENGFYILHHNGKKTGANYLRATEEEADILFSAGDKYHFRYLLFFLGIVDRWKEEANKALGYLQELTGDIWENPYQPENERFILRLSDAERIEIEKLISTGFYSADAIKTRKDEEARTARDKKRTEIIAECEKKQQEAEEKKRVLLAVLDAGLSLDNAIYYDHKRELVFNWLDYCDKITKEEFNNFVSSVDRSSLPEDVTFKLK